MGNDLPNINDLLAFGFKKCGRWKDQQTFELDDDSIENVLYAFATQEYVGYIGKAKRKLKTRLNSGYKIKNENLVHKGITENIEKLIDIIILYYKPESVRYKGFEIDMLSGLEIPLAKKFKSRWNKQGYGVISRVVDNIIEDILP